MCRVQCAAPREGGRIATCVGGGLYADTDVEYVCDFSRNGSGILMIWSLVSRLPLYNVLLLLGCSHGLNRWLSAPDSDAFWPPAQTRFISFLTKPRSILDTLQLAKTSVGKEGLGTTQVRWRGLSRVLAGSSTARVGCDLAVTTHMMKTPRSNPHLDCLLLLIE